MSTLTNAEFFIVIGLLLVGPIALRVTFNLIKLLILNVKYRRYEPWMRSTLIEQHFRG